ncbi:hypothetical protein EDD76_10973 [Kineothrix alysoides]|uniref:Uncharacterized protein n=1 Tax=Kineothrix alysoides TaxID=1469948 RepID=A0A4R1QVP5_9FIRM|nr:hypothetical protein [Kineothrix alysoides]TCL57211.1 hypothetical protein EDD76_10973 [Kineothrix alysoides]
MLEVFLEHKLLCGAFLILLLLSIICQIMIGAIYQKMIKETDNMSSTNNKFLKQCKLKFAHCYQLNEGVSNIPIFVDKFISRVSFMGISLTGFKHLSGQLMLLSIVAAGAGACREIVSGETVGKVLPYYIISFLGLYVFFSISGLVDIQGKRERLKVNLVDYLENHMANKLRQSAIDWAEITGGEKIDNAGLVKKAEKADKPEKNSIEIKNSTEIKSSAETKNSLEPKRDIEAMREEIGLAPRRKEQEAERRSKMEEDKPEPFRKDYKKTIFSHQEKQELEELLREFFV